MPETVKEKSFIKTFAMGFEKKLDQRKFINGSHCESCSKLDTEALFTFKGAGRSEN